MKKKSGPAASRAAKRRKSGVGKPAPARKATPLRVRPGKVPRPASRVPVKSNGARLTLRKLRARLADALKRIAELEASADTDFLLDIPNRRGFEREFHRAIAYIQRYQASGALIVLDVDRLKPINDAFGHAAGDQVLKAIAAALVRQVRSSDVVGRLGGDEFAVLLWNLTETDAQGQSGLAGRGHRPARLHVSRPQRQRGRIGRRRRSRPACRSRPRTGGSRQRDVSAQGAAPARILRFTGRSDRPAHCRISGATRRRRIRRSWDRRCV